MLTIQGYIHQMFLYFSYSTMAQSIFLKYDFRIYGWSVSIEFFIASINTIKSLI